MSQTAKKKTKRELTYQQIRSRILSGDLKSGQRISANALAQEFGVARSTVHESLARLQDEGLVRNDGAYARTYVEEPDLPKVIEHYEARECVEGMAARLAAHNMNSYQVDELTRLGQQVFDAMQAEDFERSGKANREFHHYLVSHCGNALLLKMYEMHHLMPVWVRLQESSDSFLRPKTLKKDQKHLEKICDAIRARDADKAEELVRITIRRVIEQLRAIKMSGAEATGE